MSNASTPLSTNIVQITGLKKDLTTGQAVVHALRGVDLTVEEGEYLAVVGPSGSGKTTLLGLIGGLDAPTEGRVVVTGVDITGLGEDRLAEIRNAAVGFVFQFFNLIPTLTALENVELPVQFAARARFDPSQRARELLEMVGLGDRLHHRPPELSGGEQQRTAIARALANDPPLLLADEPTGNLDSATGEEILRLLRRLCDESGQTVIMVTHDPRVAAYADRVAFLQDGRIVEEARLERGRDARMILARLVEPDL
jgi:putative ABC transport system ATP-binding protein